MSVKKTFLKYLMAAFISSSIASIYGLVDVMAVGNYHGELGTASMSVIMPVFNILYSLGLMLGIGGGVLFSNSRGINDKNENKYFSASVVLGILISLVIMALFFCFTDEILTLFGASNSDVLILSKDYFFFIKIFCPCFIFNQMLLAFVRNDDNPLFATICVLIGGIFNIFGDIFFVFNLNMGIKGAGLATALGALITTLCLCIHFFTKKNTLKLDLNIKGLKAFRKIVVNGFSAFILDFSVGIVTIIFNTLASIYFGSVGLAMYGLIVNIAIFVQCLGYATGQAAQPLISKYYGAKEYHNIKKIFNLALITSSIIGIIFTLIMLVFPKEIITLFINTTDTVKEEGSLYVRLYSLGFLFLPFNIFITYYLQSIMQSKKAFLISSLRGYIINVIIMLTLCAILPIILWLVLLITETLVLLIGTLIYKKVKLNS